MSRSADAGAAPSVSLDLDAFRGEVQRWLEANAARHAAQAAVDDLAADVAAARALQRELWDAGLMRAGWPTRCGGLGGDPILRAALAEALAGAGLLTGTGRIAHFGFIEILGPAFLARAEEPLLQEALVPFISGREAWCQGFSEPEAGSDLASLRTRARPSEDGWVLNGQKVWTSLAQFADRCIVLARTGAPEDRHRGISAFLVDMDTPGITVRPIATIGGAEEFCELFLDDVVIGADRLVGELNEGWAFTMHVLACERGAVFWQGAAQLVHQLRELVAHADLHERQDQRIGEAYLDIYGLRARSRQTQEIVAAGRLPGPDASLDKLLMVAAEQRLFDLARDLLSGTVELGDDASARRWRAEYFYSRAASIYGGTAEIQRSIVAERLLGLPRER